MEIPLTNRKGEVVAHALIDDEDAHLLPFGRWHLHGRYAAHKLSNPSRTVLMHRIIAGLPWHGRDRQVHHKNGNGLDNRRANLEALWERDHRTIHNAEINAKPKARPATRGKGYGRNGRRWRVEFQHDGQRINLGQHDTEEQAAAVVAAWRAENDRDRP